MSSKAKTELAVGAFVVIGIVALLMLALKVSNFTGFSNGNNYELNASFENIGGLKVRAPVMMAGVRIGEVTDVGLDMETFEANVTLSISSQYAVLPKDSSASIFTSGLLGEQYIAMEAGGDEEVLKSGDSIVLVQSAMVLEQVLGQFLFSKAAGDE